MVAKYRLRLLNLGRELHRNAAADNKKLQLQFPKMATATFRKIASACVCVLLQK
jgi:hypothetical protein